MVAICMSACVLDVQFWREAVIPNETFNCILLSSWLNELTSRSSNLVETKQQPAIKI